MLNPICTVDVSQCYHQIMLDEETSDKLSFLSSRGCFKYLRAPYGLSQLPMYLTRKIEEFFFRWQLYNHVFPFFDDFLIPTLVSFRQIFDCLRSIFLRFSHEKYKILFRELPFFGFSLSAAGFRPKNGLSLPSHQSQSDPDVVT